MRAFRGAFEFWYPGCQLASWQPVWRKVGLVPLGGVIFTIVLGWFSCVELYLFPRILQTGWSAWLLAFATCFHALVLMIFWSLALCVLLDAGPVPVGLNYANNSSASQHAGKELLLLSEEGVVCARKCHVCKSAKPARAHHCLSLIHI